MVQGASSLHDNSSLALPHDRPLFTVLNELSKVEAIPCLPPPAWAAAITAALKVFATLPQLPQLPQPQLLSSIKLELQSLDRANYEIRNNSGDHNSLQQLVVERDSTRKRFIARATELNQYFEPIRDDKSRLVRELNGLLANMQAITGQLGLELNNSLHVGADPLHHAIEQSSRCVTTFVVWRSLAWHVLSQSKLSVIECSTEVSQCLLHLAKVRHRHLTVIGCGLL